MPNYTDVKRWLVLDHAGNLNLVKRPPSTKTHARVVIPITLRVPDDWFLIVLPEQVIELGSSMPILQVGEVEELEVEEEGE